MIEVEKCVGTSKGSLSHKASSSGADRGATASWDETVPLGLSIPSGPEYGSRIVTIPSLWNHVVVMIREPCWGPPGILTPTRLLRSRT